MLNGIDQSGDTSLEEQPLVRVIPDDGDPFERFAPRRPEWIESGGVPPVYVIPDDDESLHGRPIEPDEWESAEGLVEQSVREDEEEQEQEEPGVVYVAPEDDVPRRLMQQASAEREKLLEAARTEAMQIRAQARAEGLAQAYEEKAGEIDNCLKRVDEMLDLLDQRQQTFLTSYEKGLRELALDIAEKVIRQQLGQSDGAMLALVSHAVSAFKNEDWISVEVSDEMPGLVDYLKRAAEAARDGVRIEVNPISAPPDHCVISTSQGVIDASVTMQMENLKEMLERMD